MKGCGEGRNTANQALYDKNSCRSYGLFFVCLVAFAFALLFAVWLAQDIRQVCSRFKGPSLAKMKRVPGSVHIDSVLIFVSVLEVKLPVHFFLLQSCLVRPASHPHKTVHTRTSTIIRNPQ